jgi:hypothetical protein
MLYSQNRLSEQPEGKEEKTLILIWKLTWKYDINI